MLNKQGLLYVTPKSTFYNSREEVIAKGKESHAALMAEDRTLYTYLLFFPNATYYAKSLIIQNLLGDSINKHPELTTADPKLLEIEDALIHNALMNENITHALKMLTTLKEARINNSRTSKVILRFLFDRGNLDRIVIKYKKKVKELLIHAIGQGNMHAIARGDSKGTKVFQKQIAVYGNPFAQEVIGFLAGKNTNYQSANLQAYDKVRALFLNGQISYSNAIEELKQLPLEVLEGFNSGAKTKLMIEYLLQNANLSEKQKVQVQKRVDKINKENVDKPIVKVVVEVDYTKQDVFDLYRLLYSGKEFEVEERLAILHAINEKNKEFKQIVREKFDLGSDYGVIVDASGSHAGSKETRLNAFLKNHIMSEAFVDDLRSNLITVGGSVENGLLHPEGHTDLASALLLAAEKGFKTVVLFSDGFENVNSFDSVHKALAQIGLDIKVLHFNPVFSPKNFSFKTVGDNVATIPYASHKDLATLNYFYLLAENPELFKAVVREEIEKTLLEGGDK